MSLAPRWSAGEACAKKFAAEGCKVVVSDLDPVKSDKVAADINAAVGAGAAISGAFARRGILPAFFLLIVLQYI